jgi:HEAT repeat protein
MEQVHNALNQFEPTYEEAERLGVEALPHLEILVKSAEPILASQAAAMASRIHDQRSVKILMSAAQSEFRQVRVAVAYSARNLRFSRVNKILNILKNDQDRSIRRIAKKSIELKRKEVKNHKETIKKVQKE